MLYTSIYIFIYVLCTRPGGAQGGNAVAAFVENREESGWRMEEGGTMDQGNAKRNIYTGEKEKLT